jgi:hypothetical protein
MTDTIKSIINPKTGRPIRVGGKLYNSLIREGLVKGIIEEKNNSLYDINENDDLEFVKNELSKNLPFNETAVRGKKGTKYENKIVKRKKVPNASEVASETIKLTANKIKNKEIDFDDDDFAKNLEQMILAELLNEKPKKSKPIPIKREKAKPKKREFIMRKLPEPETETEIEFEETEIESDIEVESVESEESD